MLRISKHFGGPVLTGRPRTPLIEARRLAALMGFMMSVLFRKPVEKSKSAKQFRNDVKRTKSANVVGARREDGGQVPRGGSPRGGIRL